MSKTSLIASMLKVLLGKNSVIVKEEPFYSTGRKSIRVKGHNRGQKCTTCGDNCGQCGTTD